MKTNWIKKLLPGCILGVLMITIFLLYGDAEKIWDIARHIKSNSLVWAGFFAFCIYVGRYIKWNYFLKALHVNLPMTKTAPVFFACLSMGLTPGKVGEVLKSYLLDKLYDIDFAKTAPTIFAERVTGTLGCLLLCIASLCILGGTAHYREIFYAITAMALIIFLLYMSKTNLLLWLFDRLAKIKFMARWSGEIRNFYESSIKLLGWKVIFFGICISCLYWMMECLVFYSLLQGVGINQGVVMAAFTLTSVSIGGGLTMSPGSIGALEGGLLGVLVYQGVPFEAAGCVVFMHRVYAMWSVVIFGSILLVKKYYKVMCDIN